MMEQISVTFCFSNDSFRPENEGSLVIFDSLFDRGTSAQNTNVSGFFCFFCSV